jgi:hypothetical protein
LDCPFADRQAEQAAVHTWSASVIGNHLVHVDISGRLHRSVVARHEADALTVKPREETIRIHELRQSRASLEITRLPLLALISGYFHGSACYKLLACRDGRGQKRV